MNAPIATVRTHDDLIEALRSAREMRNLSYAWLDEFGDFTVGHVNKVLGPRREKGLSPFTLQMLCSLLAVKFELVPDPEQEARMRSKWEGRDMSNVRLEPSRISQKVMERVKPLVLKDLASAGGKARARMHAGTHLSKIGRKAARARWRKHRKTMRERLKERKEKGGTLRDSDATANCTDAAPATKAKRQMVLDQAEAE